MEFLNWIYERMVEVHHENPNYDYMLRFKSIIDGMKPSNDDLKKPVSPVAPKRKIIQISAITDHKVVALYALCNDGSAWVSVFGPKDSNSLDWLRVPDIPQDE